VGAPWLDLFSLPKMKDLVLPKVELLFASRFAADPDPRPRKDDCSASRPSFNKGRSMQLLA